jgi:transposase
MPAALFLQTRDNPKVAKSTTAEEFEDNLWYIVDVFYRKTGAYPLLCYDNASIQKAINVTRIQYAQGLEGKQVYNLSEQLDLVDLPTYSPDMNRVIEHTFAVAKQRVREMIYRGERDYSKGLELQKSVWKVFHSLDPGSIGNDTKGLPLLWRVLSTPEGTSFQYPPWHQHVGTGGGYAPAKYC